MSRLPVVCSLRMNNRRHLHSALIGLCALVITGAQFAPPQEYARQLLSASPSSVNETIARRDSTRARQGASAIASLTRRAIDALANAVGPLSTPDALTDAVRSYFAYRSAHPGDVRNPYLYFVDYGLPSTTPRG